MGRSKAQAAQTTATTAPTPRRVGLVWPATHLDASVTCSLIASVAATLSWVLEDEHTRLARRFGENECVFQNMRYAINTA